MFSLSNFFGMQVAKAQVKDRNKRIEKAAIMLAPNYVGLWGAYVKRLTLKQRFSAEGLQSVMDGFLTENTLSPFDSDVKEISDRIIELTLEHKERVTKNKETKELFHRLAKLVAKNNAH